MKAPFDPVLAMVQEVRKDPQGHNIESDEGIRPVVRERGVFDHFGDKIDKTEKGW